METALQNRFQLPSQRMFLLVGVLFVFAACNSDFAAAVRRVTYPPDFVYISGEELRDSMEQLAFQLAQLDEALAGDESRQPDQQEVQIILGRIERIGSSLQAGDAGASHGFLEDDMPRFVSDVTRARMAASLDPPQYYLAGRVAGSCMNCHRVNR